MINILEELKRWVEKNKYDPNEDKIEYHGGVVDVDDLLEKMGELELRIK